MVNKIKMVCGGCYEMFYTSEKNPKSVHDRSCYFLSIHQKKVTKEIFNVTCAVCKNDFKSTRKEEEFCSTNCGIEQFKLGTRTNSLPVGFQRGTLNDHLLVTPKKNKAKKKLGNN